MDIIYFVGGLLIIAMISAWAGYTKGVVKNSKELVERLNFMVEVVKKTRKDLNKAQLKIIQLTEKKKPVKKTTKKTTKKTK